MKKQMEMPLIAAINSYLKENPCRFHMPGHKGGQGAEQELINLIGEQAFKADLTEVAGLDDLHQPEGAIKKAQELAAASYGAKESFFLINGATAGIEAAFLAILKPGEKILVPRNAHRSVYNALVLSGAYPVYVNPTQHEELRIPLGVNLADWKEAFSNHPEAKALFLVSPSYEGIVAINEKLINWAKERNLTVIVDEAHGGHFPFHPNLPPSAIRLGSDIVVHGSHKTTGSFTQSGILHLGQGMERNRFQAALALVQSTSPSYLLMASLDGARRKLAIEGRQLLAKTAEITTRIRREINSIKGFRSWYEELYNDELVLALDFTKIILDGLELGFTGYELEQKLREEFNIQVEMATATNILLIFGLGDDLKCGEKLISALREISQTKNQKSSLAPKDLVEVDYFKIPQLRMSPRESFFAEKETIPLREAIGEISGELLIPYPPGIPLVCPGEEISAAIVEQILGLKKVKVNWQGPLDTDLNKIRIIKNKTIS